MEEKNTYSCMYSNCQKLDSRMRGPFDWDRDAYEDFEVVYDQPWGEDSELVEQWFSEGEQLKTYQLDWIYWVDLYKDKPDRSDLIVHWLRCLFDPALPRPYQLRAS